MKHQEEEVRLRRTSDLCIGSHWWNWIPNPRSSNRETEILSPSHRNPREKRNKNKRCIAKRYSHYINSYKNCSKRIHCSDNTGKNGECLNLCNVFILVFILPTTTKICAVEPEGRIHKCSVHPVRQVSPEEVLNVCIL
ncbi:hypothetical protein AVEN_2874-1 [Araneus ventricosus]|uniref:Uncharacterized protein n=1 Tax=Araneus ventricosus TaxID=182803 RepID=A0A4Y2CZJ4_ARAVE|nr:hypothetical protein AVEN_2874-1 [Araneus ventricosus]